MTNPDFPQHPEIGAFEERIATLATELDLAIKWDRSSALLAIYNSEYVRAEAETAVENFLIEQGQKVIHIQMDNIVDLDIVSFLQQHPTPTNCVFFVNQIKKPISEKTNIFIRIGNHKDILINKKIRIIFWLTQNLATQMLSVAPDFWEFRQHSIEFIDSPRPEVILQNAIESVWQGIGEYSDQIEDTEEKICMRENFLDKLPQDTEATSTRANLLLTLGILHWRKGNYEKANECLNNSIKEAVKLEDSWFEAECFNALALVYFSQGKNDKAIEAYKQAIAIAPGQIFVWNNLGNLCMKIMRNDEAMLAFQKALQHNEKDPVAWNGLGNVYYTIGYIDDAISAYRKAIEFAPTLAQPWSGLGDAYVSVGRDLDAIAAFQKAIEINKQFITPWLRLADIYCRQGRNKDAIKTFRRALNVEPNNPLIWNDLGLTLIKINAFEDAIRAFNEASKLDRSFGWAYCNLALCYANQKKYAEAIELCRKSLFVFTEDIDKVIACDRMASYYRAINDYENAVEAYQLADRLKGHVVSNPHKSNREALISFSQPQTEFSTEIPYISPSQKPIDFDKSNATIKIKQGYQSEPDWAIQSPSWNPGTSTISTDSEYLICNKKPLEFSIEKEATPEQTTEVPPMSTELSFFSHPIGNRNATLELFESSFNIGEMTETKNPVVWNEKGNIHFQNHAYDEAIIAYNKAIELDRSFGWPYSNLALTYLSLGKYAEAILLYQKSICLLKTNEEKACSWNNLGNIYRHQGNYEEALNAYQNADEIDPQNAGGRDKVDIAYSEPNSQNAQVWLELGNLFFKTRSYAEAVNAYTKAVKIDPTSGWAHSNLAMSLVFQGKYKDAAPVYLKSITLFNNDNEKAITWNRLGNVYRKMNDYDNAKKAYQNAIKLSNEKTSVLTRTRFSLLGNCYSN